MIREKKFFQVFRKNCRNLLVSKADAEVAITNLKDKGCPFPKVCEEASPKEGHCGCIAYTRKSCKLCPISKEWQNNVFYFMMNKFDSDLCSRMIEVVKEIT